MYLTNENCLSTIHYDTIKQTYVNRLLAQDLFLPRELLPHMQNMIQVGVGLEGISYLFGKCRHLQLKPYSICKLQITHQQRQGDIFLALLLS